MMLRLTTLLFAGLLAACNHSGRWISESEGGPASLAERGDTLEIVAPEGLTLWYPEPLSGDYRIRYDATVVIGGGAHDRLARSAWRAGTFARYNSLDLFYVGYGGNDNTTTRFRKYHGRRFGAPADEVKPLLGQYTDTAHLLRPNRPLRIEITVAGGRTTYAADGEVLFSRELAPGEGDGYFGLRLLANHTLIANFGIERL